MYKSKEQSLENTGRISEGLTWSARRIIFGETVDSALDAELKLISLVDIAHLTMLAECGIIDRDKACRLVSEINKLRAIDFEPLRSRMAPRGLYLLYENYLIEKLGHQTGGTLQTARSRNDLNATVLRLRLREVYLRLLRESLRLYAVVLRRSRRYADVVMPAYTHFQAAVPITYGHYLAGIACALARDIGAIIESSKDLDRCPLGAGAVGGTSLPIRPDRTASLLGFDKPVLHSVDSVASRDLVLRLLASSAILGVTLSRVSNDLLVWNTSEFGFLIVPDNLVGSSSMMPQKRNLFLLEHIQGRSTSTVGAFVSSAMGMHKAPFTNSIAVGTEAVAPVWNALKGLTEAVVLLRLVIAGASPQRETMLRAAEKGYTSATEFANRLAVEGGMAFRTAHHAVGSLIRTALENDGSTLQEIASQWSQTNDSAISLQGLDPTTVAQTADYGGGPGRRSFRDTVSSLLSEWAVFTREKKEQTHKWRGAQKALDEAARQLCESEQGSD